jgi:hypothetical protein
MHHSCCVSAALQIQLANSFTLISDRDYFLITKGEPKKSNIPLYSRKRSYRDHCATFNKDYFHD